MPKNNLRHIFFNLKSLTNNSENVTIEYKYDSNGIRTEKKVNDKIYQYYLEGNKVIYENQNGKLIYYNYDGNGDLIGFNISGEQYYYIRNVQNDIIGILDDNFNQIVKYNYDSWGNIISILDDNGNDVTNNIEHIGNINPYRFKGYRYDNETKMYYLNSRYYNPEIGRFISFDNYGGTVGDLLSHNGYIYCKNNPINMTDESGNFAVSSVITAGIFVIGSILILNIVEQLNPNMFSNLANSISSAFSAIDSAIESAVPIPKQKSAEKDIAIDDALPYKNLPNGLEYYEAYLIAGDVQVGRKITMNEAIARVGINQNVMCNTQHAAYILARIFTDNPILEIDSENTRKPGKKYYWHYHINSNHGNPHIWFY